MKREIIVLIVSIFMLGCEGNAKDSNKELNLPKDYACSLASPSDISKIVNGNVSDGRLNNKLHFPKTYMCKYFNGKSKVLPAVTIYYFAKKRGAFAMYNTKKKIDNISHEAYVVTTPSSGSVVQIYGFSKKGVVSIVWYDEVKNYKQSIKLLDKLLDKAKWWKCYY